MKIINGINDKTLNINTMFFTDKFKCTSAAIFYENNIPYIDWKGTTILSNGSIANVHIPKMSLDISKIENECEYQPVYSSDNCFLYNITKSRQVFVKDGFEPDEDVIIEIKEREMTKEQIEKELGYKIKIKE